MKGSVRAGLSFGVTSAIITVIGLMIGLSFGTNSTLVVVGGIITIAIADAFADALGYHVSVESRNKYSDKQVWVATISAFLSKFIIAASFIVPILIWDLYYATIISSVWGLLLLSVFSYFIAKRQAESPAKVIFEHVGIAILVIIVTYLVGSFVSNNFK